MTVLEVQLPDKMIPFVTERKRHKIARGGRGSAKSWSIARILAARGVAKRTRWLCCREVQKSIKQSSHKLLSNQIRALGLGASYDIQETVIKGPNETEFVFAGLQDHTSESIKSYEDFDGAWIEEAHTVSERSANTLIPTIRAPGSELWWSYNPDQGDDFVHKMAERPDENVLVVNINWRDNPWFPQELELERVRMKALNADLYEHIWEGKLRTLAGLLFKRRWFKFYSAVPENLSNYMASDYAGAPDPDRPDSEPDFTEHGNGGLNEGGDLYLTDWYSDQTDPEQYINGAVAMIRRNKPKIWFEEKGVILRSIDAAVTKRLREKQCTSVLRYPLASAGSKAERALGFAARCSAGTVWLPDPVKHPWAQRLLNQLCAFTGEEGKVDDGVDVCSLLARGLDVMSNARSPAKSTRKVIIPFTRSHFEGKDPDDEDRNERQRNVYR